MIEILGKKLPDDVDPEAVFACKRLDLRDIDVYGFDYDYTIACYRPELEKLIYDLGREVLIDVYKVGQLSWYLFGTLLTWGICFEGVMKELLFFV